MTHTDQTNRLRRRPRTRAAAVAATAALCLLPAACGGAGDAASADTATDQNAAAAGNDSFEAFQQCMADNGIDMGSPQPGAAQPDDQSSADQGSPPSFDSEAMQQAQEACGDLMPDGGPGGSGGPGGPGGPGAMDTEAVEAWTDCLADNGVDVEMPEPGAAPQGAEPPSDGATPPSAPEGGAPDALERFGLDTSDLEVAAAVEACADLQPSAQRGPGAGGTDAGTDDAASGAATS